MQSASSSPACAEAGAPAPESEPPSLVASAASPAPAGEQEGGALPAASLAAGLAKDVDLDALAVRLDAHSRSLRSDLLSYFLELKAAQAAQRAQVMAGQGHFGGSNCIR